MGKRDRFVDLGEPVSDEFLLTVANIIGSGSAALAAITERDRRVDAGEDAVVYWNRDRGVLSVGPRRAEFD